jgi:hypothetical protein
VERDPGSYGLGVEQEARDPDHGLRSVRPVGPGYSGEGNAAPPKQPGPSGAITPAEPSTLI